MPLQFRECFIFVNLQEYQVEILFTNKRRYLLLFTSFSYSYEIFYQCKLDWIWNKFTSFIENRFFVVPFKLSKSNSPSEILFQKIHTEALLNNELQPTQCSIKFTVQTTRAFKNDCTNMLRKRKISANFSTNYIVQTLNFRYFEKKTPLWQETINWLLLPIDILKYKYLVHN